jgi:hypothetical protein
MDSLFSGTKFRVVEEVRSDEPLATPLGYKVKNGYRLTSTDGTSNIVVGKTLLRTLDAEYNAIEEMPEPKRRGRPRKQPIEQAEDWASRDIPNDAEQITQPGPTYTNPNANESL